MTPKSLTMRLRYEDDMYVVVIVNSVVKNYQWFCGHERYGKYHSLSNLPPNVQRAILEQLTPLNITP